jgi:hypothetical protein
MFELDFSFEVNGKKVSPDQFGNEFEKAVLMEITDTIKSKLESVICEEHQQRPKIKIVGSGSDEIQFEINGCCQKLIDDATAKLK